MFEGSNWTFVIVFYVVVFVIIGAIISGIFIVPSYYKGYKNGQIDYQKGIIKYELQEVTTDVIRRLK